MAIKHNELIIKDENPFENCKLGRKKYADVLTSIVANYSEGFVLAINNEWGAGKTTFVKMWNQQLRNEGFRTLLFNAWENDFELNPLAAVLGELKKLFPKEENKKFKKLVKAGTIIAKNTIPALIKGFGGPHLKTEELKDIIDGASKGVLDVLEKEVEAYAKKQKGIHDFRNALQEYVTQGKHDKPLIFIIDELDRCRPNYAVEVLEQMKHFFSVSGIVFVLSIDKVQLGNAVKGVYGSESMDSSEYLRRFIDVEYSIPSPSITDYCKYLFDYYDFNSFFNNAERGRFQDLKGEENFFKLYSELLFIDKNLTLRQIEKLYSHARIALTSFSLNNYVFPTVYLYLIFVFHYKRNLFEDLKARKVPIQNFLADACGEMPSGLKNDHYTILNNAKALLWFFYYNYYREDNPGVLLFEQSSDGAKVNLKSNVMLGHPIDKEFFERKFYHFPMSDFNSFSISFLLERVALLKNLEA